MALTCKPCPKYAGSFPGRLGVESCVCNPGFSGENGGPCLACELGEYKGRNGSAPCAVCEADAYTEVETAAVSCINCPKNSNALYGSSGAMSCSCNQGYSGPRCIVFSPKNAACPAGNSRKFEVEMSLSIQASSDHELARTRTKSAKEIANYFGATSTLPVFLSNTFGRRAVYDLTLKTEIEGNQEEFTNSAAAQAGALTSFLQLRGLKGVSVLNFVVKCGAGFTIGADSKCAPCDVGTYKQMIDNSGCIECPKSKTTHFEGAIDVAGCSKWAGQRLTRKTAEDVGYVISAVVGSVVGINTVGAVVGVLSTALGVATIGTH